MQEFEFKKDLDEMNDAELRATLREFRTEYDDAKEQYDDIQDDVSEYKQRAEEAEEKAELVEEIKPTFASMFAEMKDLDEDLVEDKFTADELVEELEDADAFSLDLNDVESKDDKDENTFTEKEQKSEKVGDDTSKFDDRIEEFMKDRVRTY